MCLRPRLGPNFARSKCSLVCSRRSRPAIWKTASAPVNLCALLYASGAGGFCARQRLKPASLERPGRLPGRSVYREFYRDIGFDLPMEHLGPVARGTRKFSGVKYHRITGRDDGKQLYDRAAAENAAATHASHFLEQRREQIREISELGFNPIVVAPFDAELFGHWWFEGPSFLEHFIRQAASQRDFSLTTPSEYLAAHSTQQIVEPAASTWGENGHLAVWLDASNAWIYPHLQVAVERMSEAARRHTENASPLADRVLKIGRAHV